MGRQCIKEPKNKYKDINVIYNEKQSVEIRGIIHARRSNVGRHWKKKTAEKVDKN